MSAITVPSIVSTAEDPSLSVLRQSNEAQAEQQPKPNQPLPGSAVGVSNSQLWRMVQESMKLAASAFSGTGKENSEAKKTLIELQKNTQIDSLNERMAQIEEQKQAQKSQGIWGKIAMAFGFLAAIVMAPFNPVMAAVMIGVMIAAIVLPKIVDKILQAAGVSEEIRGYVSMGLEIAIGIIGMVVSFNPGNFLASASKAAASGAAKVANLVDKAVDALNTFKSFTTLSTKIQNTVNKIMKFIEPLLDKLKSFAVGGEKLTAQIGQASSVGSNLTSVVSSGYGIKSADITKDLEIAQAEQEELATRIQQILMMLSQALRAVSHAFESLFKVNSDQREFNDKIISINM
ncbi:MULTISPECIES: VspD [Shewanella]|nr:MULTISPECIES: VspD [Shewanella]